MDLTKPEVLAWIAAGGLLLVAGSRLRTWLDRARQRLRLRRAQRGERRAPRLLEARGYRVIDSQPSARLAIRVDGEQLEISLRADFLVERGGRRFVAEVKTGQRAPSPRSAETRRQLLEYRLAYDVSGVLLVDMEAERVHRIEFPIDAPRRRGSGIAWLTLGGLLGALGARLLDL